VLERDCSRDSHRYPLANATKEGHAMGKALRTETVWTILLGPGPRLAGFESLARSVHAALHAGIASELTRFDDLALLLGERAKTGRLVLDADHLPAEDLGFVRRFLEARPAWSLQLIGQDAGRQSARAVLSLARTTWMAWPPDLEQLQELLRAPESILPRPAPAQAAGVRPRQAQSEANFERELGEIAALAGRARESFARLSDTGEPGGAAAAELGSDLAQLSRTARSLVYRVAPPGPGSATVELGTLLEEQLAALTLRGKKSPRFLYRGPRGVMVRADRAALVTALEAVLLLARGNAAAGEMIRVELAMESGAPGAVVRVEFPEGDLAGVDLERLFEPNGVSARSADLGSGDLAAARAVVEALGGRLELNPGSGNTLQIQLHLPAEQEQEVPAAVPEGVPAAAEDPFA
jgi:hypothetical protein